MKSLLPILILTLLIVGCSRNPQNDSIIPEKSMIIGDFDAGTWQNWKGSNVENRIVNWKRLTVLKEGYYDLERE